MAETEKQSQDKSCENPTRPQSCERCGQTVRPEGAHFKCDFCGWMTHCCEGGAT